MGERKGRGHEAGIITRCGVLIMLLIKYEALCEALIFLESQKDKLQIYIRDIRLSWYSI